MPRSESTSFPRILLDSFLYPESNNNNDGQFINAVRQDICNVTNGTLAQLEQTCSIPDSDADAWDELQKELDPAKGTYDYILSRGVEGIWSYQQDTAPVAFSDKGLVLARLNTIVRIRPAEPWYRQPDELREAAHQVSDSSPGLTKVPSLLNVRGGSVRKSPWRARQYDYSDSEIRTQLRTAIGQSILGSSSRVDASVNFMPEVPSDSLKNGILLALRTHDPITEKDITPSDFRSRTALIVTAIRAAKAQAATAERS